MKKPCEICKGACCEAIILDMDKHYSEDALRWFKLHGEETPFGTELKCRCSKLDTHGRCSIYDSRPKVCVEFPVGSIGCLQAVERRRPNIKEKIFRAILEERHGKKEG